MPPRVTSAAYLIPAPPLPAGACPVLGALGGPGLARRRVHALHPQTFGHEGAATAFALALAVALAPEAAAPILWVQAGAARAEGGRPCGSGLAALGLAPERVVVVAVDTALDALAAAEMGLEEAGLAAVLIELPARLPADMLKPTKRLSLRAAERSAPCLLLHATPAPVEGAVASRWQVAGRAPDVTPPHAAFMPDWTPAFDLTLARNRFGPLGRWSVLWRPPDRAQPILSASDLHTGASLSVVERHEVEHHVDPCFVVVRGPRLAVVPAFDHRSAHPRLVAADPADRSLRALAVAGAAPRHTARSAGDSVA